MFKDRIDAGKQLLKALEDFRNRADAVVIGLPRGGIPVAGIVAEGLGLPLDITCPRKLTASFAPEYALGAVTEHGEVLWNESSLVELGLSRQRLQDEVDKQTAEAKRRCRNYRAGLAPLQLSGKVILLIDDGVATGATIRAAIYALRKKNPSQIVVAIPCAPPESLRELEALADSVLCLQPDPSFRAVGQFYQLFNQTSDAEVVDWMRRSRAG